MWLRGKVRMTNDLHPLSAIDELQSPPSNKRIFLFYFIVVLCVVDQQNGRARSRCTIPNGGAPVQKLILSTDKVRDYLSTNRYVRQSYRSFVSALTFRAVYVARGDGFRAASSPHGHVFLQQDVNSQSQLKCCSRSGIQSAAVLAVVVHCHLELFDATLANSFMTSVRF